MSSNNRNLTFSLALNEALHQTMESNDSVILIGQGVKSPWYVGNTCNNLIDRFGDRRVIDTPISENTITGAAVGAALAGMPSIVVHPRVDFALFAFDPIINQAANWYYMNGGRSSVPVVFWLIINRGGEQAAQHSQALHSLFAHIPGLKVVMPSTPYDAKGLFVSSILDPNPVVFIDDRWLYELEEHVPEELYEIPMGKGIVRREGKDITLVSFSFMAKESMVAAQKLASSGIDTEVIDIRTLKPLDEEIIRNSIRKTGKLVIADGSWKFNGFSAQISALVSEKYFSMLKAPIMRVNLPDVPAPASSDLEKEFYIDHEDIIDAIEEII